MLSDEELKEIETKQAARRACLSNTPKCPPLDYDPQYSCIKHTLIDDLADESEDLLAEVKRLRAQQPTNCARCARLLDKCSECDRTEWQSVANGAMPAADVGVIVFLEQDAAPSVCGLAYLPSLDTTPPNVGAWRMLWVGPDMKIEAVDHRRVTHWMPLPPPPIKRES